MVFPFLGGSLDAVEGKHLGYIFGASIYGSNAIYVPKTLKEITLNQATSIAEGTFNDCSSLKTIVIPETVTEIGVSAFKNCQNLETIVIPELVTRIEDSTFFGCVH